MKVSDRVTVKAKTQNGKNLLGARGNTGTIIKREESVQCFFGAPGILIKFDREPKRPLKVLEDTLASWIKQFPTTDVDECRDFLYDEENDMWIQIPSKDFEITVT